MDDDDTVGKVSDPYPTPRNTAFPPSDSGSCSFYSALRSQVWYICFVPDFTYPLPGRFRGTVFQSSPCEASQQPESASVLVMVVSHPGEWA